ncbi:hypothetical protein [Thermococcus barophilus]|uniref:Uncharacterized protein n=1 Tax=Thermococcus barophilus (strain DSM 11836 / MP) TaxID=391623 RepID=F0LN64_THEBM|nr:hypothetical protein [Thermococcus barophilus]ADT85203.1 hypothetical protein TERMP_02230 [Thermococcus barophilus MP]
MPSWRVHKKWGERILGFSTSKIDQLIDQDETHDAGRYDINIFERQVTHVKSLYGETGVEYYILHHLLDYAEQRLLSILSDEAIREYYERTRSAEEVLREVRRKLLEDLQEFKLKDDPFIAKTIKKIVKFYQNLDMLDELIFDIMNGDNFPKRLGNIIYMKAIPHSKSWYFIDQKKVDEIVNIAIECIGEIFGILAKKFQ